MTQRASVGSKASVTLLILLLCADSVSLEENRRRAVPPVTIVVIAFREGVYLRHCLSRVVSAAQSFAIHHGLNQDGDELFPQIMVVETAANEPASFRRHALAAAAASHSNYAVRVIYNTATTRLSISQVFRRIESIGRPIHNSTVDADTSSPGYSEEHRPQFYLFVDDSTELLDGAVEKMVAAAVDPSVAIVGAESR